jgi:aminomuconate-semialdehyde/2-hydroxymuconate-6-semialdehyde dehydrogenase
MIEIKNYIDGLFVAHSSPNSVAVYEPATGKQYATLPDSTSGDVENAYQAAKKAFPKWKNISAEERFKILEKVAHLIEVNHERLAQAESRDTGKPIWLTRKVDIYRAAANFRFFATAAMQFSSESHHTTGEAINYTLRQPIGVVGCISPWNLPLYLFTWKIAPALAAGNTVVAKPSEVTPMTAYLLAEICAEAGLPAGVLNIVHGTGASAGKAIIEHSEIKAISFTGGTSTGAEIARIAAPMFKKLSLELGGKNPNLVFADCNLDDAVETSVRASFTNQGQICLCGSRIFVEKSIYDDFVSRFVSKVKALKVGNPFDEDNFMGAVVSRPHLEKIAAYVELAKEEGGDIACGGNILKLEGGLSEGWYHEPTVILNLKHTCRTASEEIFGPVVTIIPFDNEEEALEFANHGRYGLAAMVWTENLKRAHRVAEKLESGIVWVNCWMLRDLRTPFGGVKDSGVGREGGNEVMRFFTETKNVCIKY